jgi:RNA polymerase sigma-70 factor (ECF subfamily)
MYRIALNVAISFYRKEKNKNAFLTNTELPENHEDKSTDTTETESNINRLQLLINEMPALDKALMILYLESKAYAEIAEILGITETNVATKLSRIKSRLKKQLSTQNS